MDYAWLDIRFCPLQPSLNNAFKPDIKYNNDTLYNQNT